MIEIQGLTKKFGNFTAVDHIDLTIRDGEFFGLLGPNGAGKTTLLKMIAGEMLSRKDIKAQYMPQNYEEMLDLDVTPVEFLDEICSGFLNDPDLPAECGKVR